MEIDPANIYSIRLKKRTSDSQEHKIYWKYVKASKYFHNDPIFADNPEIPAGKLLPSSYPTRVIETGPTMPIILVGTGFSARLRQ